MLSPIAKELNSNLTKVNPLLYQALAKRGQLVYFPKGILAQSKEANEKAHRFNATIGIATSHQQPMHLPELQQFFTSLGPKDIYSYAPAAGRLKLRGLWKEHIKQQNPLLKDCSLPVVTSGITQGISAVASLFVDPHDQVIIPDLSWDNYSLIFEVMQQANLVTYPLFDNQSRFNIPALKEKIAQALARQDKALIILNFPHNPSGYALSTSEQDEILAAISATVAKDKFLTVLVDDAYFGLVHEPEPAKASIFQKLAGLADNVLAIKVDGATKELFAWGLRIGFLTFGYPHSAAYAPLENKSLGLMRATLSNCSNPAQAMLEKVLTEDSYKKTVAAKLKGYKRPGNSGKTIIGKW